MDHAVRAKTSAASTGGSFAAHTHTPADIELKPASWLGSEDVAFGRDGACGDIAAELHTLTGWQVVILTPDDGENDAWVHAAVRTPSGDVLDATGVSPGGQHLLDDDGFYEAFTADELAAADGEVTLVDVPAARVDTRQFATDPERIARIARELHTWAIEHGLAGAATPRT